ncbi:ComF family protein [Lactobacillus delbrueckii]|uniref:ComF family protein n=1 Tax=Lactobacillus delbrueckii TaxID=1584 RepID=UPI000E5A02B8|nr:double zinc ribbon domain-containing protein [Lactobacillus delbrueckii]MDA3800727.1 double zinc ribbon domain-containing protein [Lactobacillus delbrueckii]RHX67338.1 ComF family protein [Lactobacillus delbrueckii]
MSLCLFCDQPFTGDLDMRRLLLPGKSKTSCLCPSCRQLFAQIGTAFCPQCGRQQDSGEICQDCQKWRRIYQGNFLHNQAVYCYNQAFHDLMVRYKRYGDYLLCQVLQELAAPSVQKLAADYYVPVPTSPEHRKKRGYDTVWEIFTPLLPLTPLLAKKAGAGAQGEKDKKARMQAKQNFFLNPEFRGTITGKIILLDDIYTTGRTLYHARDAIEKAFPKCQVESFSISR